MKDPAKSKKDSKRDDNGSERGKQVKKAADKKNIATRSQRKMGSGSGKK